MKKDLICHDNIVLASSSPRRKELLKKIVDKFQIFPSNYEEKIKAYEEFSLNKIEITAKNKAFDVIEKVAENSIVLSSDTVVVLNNQILPKPKDKSQAFDFLNKLSNKTHFVLTSVYLANKARKKEKIFSERTEITFNNLSKAQITSYIETFKPLDKAGAYGIQDLDETFIKKIEGSFSNIVGLPLEKTKIELIKFINEIM